jgi:hypothetical protein
MKMVELKPDPPIDLVSEKNTARQFSQIKGTERLAGAMLSSMEAAIVMAEVGLTIAVWITQFLLIICFAMGKAVLTARR